MKHVQDRFNFLQNYSGVSKSFPLELDFLTLREVTQLATVESWL